jgi:hypothetical protein
MSDPYGIMNVKAQGAFWNFSMDFMTQLSLAKLSLN